MKTINIKLFKKILIQNSSVLVGIIAIGVSIYTLFSEYNNFAERELFLGIFGALGGVFIAYFMVLLKEATNIPKIYISYSRENMDIAEKIYKELNLNPFIVLMDKYELHVGDNITSKLEEILRDSDYVLFISSKDSLNSEWIKKEINRAMKLNKKIFPIKVDKTDLPTSLKGTMYADFSDSFEDGMNKLVAALKSKRKKDHKNQKHNKSNHIDP